IHDFWVPAFRMKIDAVPGITTHYRVTPKRRGSFPVVCAELCGLGHAYMRQTAHVVTREEFERKLRELRAAAGDGAPGRAGRDGEDGDRSAAGRQVFARHGCSGCHTLSDAAATGSAGPNLDDALDGMS